MHANVILCHNLIVPSSEPDAKISSFTHVSESTLPRCPLIVSIIPPDSLSQAIIVPSLDAEKIHFTGKKKEQKSYFHHTGYPGGIKERNAGKILEGKFPDRVLELAVKRMMPGGPLKRQQMTHLKIYAGASHPHDAQNPKPLDIKAMNPKNAVRG